jgi:hypothetical protein
MDFHFAFDKHDLFLIEDSIKVTQFKVFALITWRPADDYSPCGPVSYRHCSKLLRNFVERID